MAITLLFYENLTLANNDRTKRSKQYKHLKHIALHEYKLYRVKILFYVLIELSVKLVFENFTIFFPWHSYNVHTENMDIIYCCRV